VTWPVPPNYIDQGYTLAVDSLAEAMRACTDPVAALAASVASENTYREHFAKA
jgi:hypothetical protein